MYSNTQPNENFMVDTYEWVGTLLTPSLPMFGQETGPASTIEHHNIPGFHAYRVIDEAAVDQALGSFARGEYRTYVCLLCDKQFGDILNARLHVHKHWRTPQPLECIGCESTAKFSQKYSAQRHVDNREKRFRCCYCGKSYARSDYLLSHKKICAPPKAALSL